MGLMMAGCVLVDGAAVFAAITGGVGLASEKGLYSSNPGGAVCLTCVTDGS